MKRIFKAMPRAAVSSDRRRRFLAGGNLESVLAKDYHVDLTHNAAFELLYTREGRLLMQQYHDFYLQLAERYQLTYILETPTWRANRDWIYRLGYNTDEIATVNRHAVQFIRETQQTKSCDVILSGSVGPRQDGNSAGILMSSDESALYHSEQIRTFALLDVDIITARAFNQCNEAIGVAKACKALGVPVVISFKVDNYGKLSNGEFLGNAIAKVDEETADYPNYYTLHCVDAETLEHLTYRHGYWKSRVHGVLTTEKAATLGQATIKEHFPNIKIVGGCGFDFSTLDELCRQFIAD